MVNRKAIPFDMLNSNLTLFNRFSARPSDEQMCLSLILSYVSEKGASYPINIGDDYSKEQKNQMALFLIKSHFSDFKSTHCTPLPGDFFRTPWNIPHDEDFVFT